MTVLIQSASDLVNVPQLQVFIKMVPILIYSVNMYMPQCGEEGLLRGSLFQHINEPPRKA